MAATRLTSLSFSVLNDTLTLFLFSLFCLIHFYICFAQRYGFGMWVIRASGCNAGPCRGRHGVESPQAKAGTGPECPASPITQLSPSLLLLGFFRKCNQNCILAQSCWLGSASFEDACWTKPYRVLMRGELELPILLQAQEKVGMEQPSVGWTVAEVDLQYLWTYHQ